MKNQCAVCWRDHEYKPSLREEIAGILLAIVINGTLFAIIFAVWRI